MDKYERVEKLRPSEAVKESEIRVNSQGLFKDFIHHASYLLQVRHLEEIEFQALGQAISKAVATVEMVKTRFPMLHQDTAISTVSITDIWEPTEEGLFPVEITRQVSMITITLSYEELNKYSPGYQAPSGKKPSKASLQPRQGLRPYNALNEQESYGRGSGHDGGTGRGFWYEKSHSSYPRRGRATRVYGRIRAPVCGQ